MKLIDIGTGDGALTTALPLLNFSKVSWILETFSGVSLFLITRQPPLPLLFDTHIIPFGIRSVNRAIVIYHTFFRMCHGILPSYIHFKILNISRSNKYSDILSH